MDITCIWIEKPPKERKKVAIDAAFTLDIGRVLKRLRPLVISKRPLNNVFV